MTAMLYELLRAYEEAEGLIVSVAAQVEEISECMARLRRTIRMRTSGLRIALGKEPLLEEEGGHEQAAREISPAEPPAPPAEDEEKPWTSAEPDEAVDIVIGEGDAGPLDVEISFGDGIRIVGDPTGEEPTL
jgi:imidazolonepropionase-like amidohydrolase